MIAHDARFELGSDVRHRAFGEEGIVLRQDAAEVMVVNTVGARVLELIADGQDLQGIKDELLATFEVDAADIEEDLQAYLAELLAADVITIQDRS